MSITFTKLPHPHLLQQLANGSIEQNHNLSRAIRLWALLRWLYSDKAYATLADNFTYNDWRQAFFTKTHKDEKLADILNHQDPDCACIKTSKQWFLEWGVSIEEWQNLLQKYINISISDIDKLLNEPLFAQVRKSLQSDLDLLVARKCLQLLNNTSGRSKHYCRAGQLPNFITSESVDSKLTLEKQAYLAGALGMFSFLDPAYPLLAEEFSEEVDEDNYRVFLYVDYVVPESSDVQDAVDEIQSELQEIWNTENIQPLLLTYHSAHQNQIKECVVYPVCIYFMERAKYLCTYGNTPKGDINWYKYRLDRIISKRLEFLDWEDIRVPQLLREKYQDNNLPTPKIVNAQLKEAWGCDFYKDKASMVLRFEQDFHQRYIDRISVHDTFTRISYEETLKLTQQYTLNLEHRKAILDIIRSRPSTDAYYQVDYRMEDYYVVRWLRALGSKVEVILPWEMRTEMALEILNTWNLYKT
ncbi:TIGR03985 family CRISPR-associated protein [Nostoc sp. FACHB-190]|uniref:TIGR03985 family CRISPR-associated protein n=1 Tax=Nostoc sp. FACHB-190 TaxID=2692838 RepID=UPI00168929BE|nr:TIGR03985 family CRISPR-associated protein [Nostoc sp. FACHB-190]MBD2302771.1 TIGR03985 family CRISPR-associated protein [Nostoc sp. FACHB-190]